MNRINTDIVWVGASSIVNAVVLIAVQLLLVRLISPAEFGEVVLAQIFISVLETTFVARTGEVALFWITRSWNTDLHRTRSYALHFIREEAIWNTSIFFLILFFVWPISLFFGISPFWLAILGLAIPAQIGYGVSKSIFISSGCLRLQAQFEISINIIYLFLSCTLVITCGVLGFLWSIVLVAIIKTCGAKMITNSLWPKLVSTSKPIAPIKTNLSAHSIFRNLISNITTQSDVIIIGLAGSNEAVAFYKLAKTLASIPARVAPIIWNSLRPRLISSLKEKNAPYIRRLIFLPSLFLAAAGILSIVFIYSFGDSLISLMYGPYYMTLKYPIILLLIGNWIYYAITGWLSFVIVISKFKACFSKLLLMHAILVCLGAFYAQGSLNETSIAVAGAMSITSALAWWILLRTRIVMDSLH